MQYQHRLSDQFCTDRCRWSIRRQQQEIQAVIAPARQPVSHYRLSRQARQYCVSIDSRMLCSVQQLFGIRRTACCLALYRQDVKSGRRRGRTTVVFHPQSVPRSHVERRQLPAPRKIARRVTARIAAFIPGASPPLVRTAIRFIAGVLSVKRTSQFAAFALANGFKRYHGRSKNAVI